MGRPRILAAVSRPSLPLLSELLDGWCELTPVHTMRDALLHARRGEADVVLAGLHFGGSRMPMLLEMLKFQPATRAWCATHSARKSSSTCSRCARGAAGAPRQHG